MRLTHSVTIHDDAKPLGKKLVYAQVNLDPIWLHVAADGSCKTR